jgi:hypothetical protein
MSLAPWVFSPCCRTNFHNCNFEENAMGLGTILLIILILMLVGAIPTWGHSKSWGYGPSGGLGLVVILVLILLLTGRL